MKKVAVIVISIISILLSAGLIILGAVSLLFMVVIASTSRFGSNISYLTPYIGMIAVGGFAAIISFLVLFDWKISKLFKIFFLICSLLVIIASVITAYFLITTFSGSIAETYRYLIPISLSIPVDITMLIYIKRTLKFIGVAQKSEGRNILEGLAFLKWPAAIFVSIGYFSLSSFSLLLLGFPHSTIPPPDSQNRILYMINFWLFFLSGIENKGVLFIPAAFLTAIMLGLITFAVIYKITKIKVIKSGGASHLP